MRQKHTCRPGLMTSGQLGLRLRLPTWDRPGPRERAPPQARRGRQIRAGTFPRTPTAFTRKRNPHPALRRPFPALTSSTDPRAHGDLSGSVAARPLGQAPGRVPPGIQGQRRRCQWLPTWRGPQAPSQVPSTRWNGGDSCCTLPAAKAAAAGPGEKRSERRAEPPSEPERPHAAAAGAPPGGGQPHRGSGGSQSNMNLSQLSFN